MIPYFQFSGGRLQVQFPCPICKALAEETTVEVLSQDDGHAALHVSCGKCHGALVATVCLQGTEVWCAALLSDWSAAEAKMALVGDPVGVSDVLSAHEALLEDSLFSRLA